MRKCVSCIGVVHKIHPRGGTQRSCVHEKRFPLCVKIGKRGKIGFPVQAESCSRPPGRCFRQGCKMLCDGRINGCGVMVTQKNNLGDRPDPVDALVRARTVPDNVTETDYPFCAFRPDRPFNCFKSFEVAVDVRNDRDAHVRSFAASFLPPGRECCSGSAGIRGSSCGAKGRLADRQQHVGNPPDRVLRTM